MRRRIFILALTLLLFAGIYSSLVNATVNTYTYDVKQTTDSILGQPWTLQATTNDSNVVQVTFHWWFPWDEAGNSEVFPQTITYPPSFVATIIPDKQGHWGAIVDFQYADGTTHTTITHDEEIREFGPPPNFVPEVPILGTVGVAVAMLLGFAVYKKRKA